MLIFIPVETCTSEVHGIREKHLVCDSCGESYSYTIERHAVGRESAVILWARAKRRSLEIANVALEKKLKNDVEDVPCPACHRHQKSVILAKRLTLYAEYRQLGNAFLIAAIIVTLTILLVYFASDWFVRQCIPTSDFLTYANIVAIFLMVTGFSIRGIRTLVASRYNPNRESTV